jgi:gamma-tubulin complex component 2
MPASTALKHYGPLEQETLWIDHVIASLLGLETTLLSKDHKGVYYITTPPTSTTVHNLVNASLNTSTRYAKIQEFLNQHQPGYDHGLVLQALCQEVDLILKEEYLDQIESLEQKFRQTNLTLHQVLLELRHLDQTLTLLHLVVMTVQDLMGGALLNALWELQLRTLAGNLYKQKLLQRLWRRAAVPYLQCMHQWLHSGLLQDHYNEFMITTRHKPLSGDSWNRRFAIQSKHVVRGLLPTQHWQDLVLTVGKYWNAVRQCQRDALPEQQQDDKTLLQLANDPSDIAQYITNVHQQSSTRLLHLLFNKCDIERSLVTLKRYFLLDQGDFLVHFMDTAESELVKLLEDVSRGRTQHWLKMAVQLTDATSDITNTAAPQPLMPHAIRCYFADESLDNMLGIREGDPKTPSRHPYGQVTGLTGMLAFSLDFVDIPFPTSLVVSRRNLSCYQMLFRHVFYAKYIERRLVSVWLNNQRMKEFSEIRGLLGPTFCLRQRMLHFIQNFIYYVMLEVIEPNWQDMVSKIGDQQTPDDLISLHLKFLERTLEDCLLTNAALFKSLAKVMSTCLTFSEQMRRFVDTISVSKTAKVRSKRQSSISVVKHDGADKKASRKKQLALIERELRNETYQRMIQRHAQVFDDNLVDFMGKLRTLKVTNLCIRLDYNGYHSSRMSSGA